MPPRATDQRGILHPAARGVKFAHARRQPSADLADTIELYWIVRWDLRGEAPYAQETIPAPNVNFVMQTGGSRVHGVMTRRFRIVLEGKGQAFGVKFKPGGFHRFWNGSVAEITDRSLAIEDVFGPEALAIERRVLGSEDDAKQIALVEPFLRARMRAADENAALVVRLFEIARTETETNTVADLARRAGVSQRTMQRLFRRFVGVNPKWVLRRFRIQEAADRVARGTTVAWSALAQDLGYFDQAHFIRDFRSTIGRSPAEYAAQCRAVSDVLGRETRAWSMTTHAEPAVPTT